MLLDTEDKCCNTCCHLDELYCHKTAFYIDSGQSRILSCGEWQKNLKAERPKWCISRNRCSGWGDNNIKKCICWINDSSRPSVTSISCRHLIPPSNTNKELKLPKPLIFSPDCSQKERSHYLTECFNQLREYLKAKGI